MFFIFFKIELKKISSSRAEKPSAKSRPSSKRSRRRPKKRSAKNTANWSNCVVNTRTRNANTSDSATNAAS